MSITAEAREKVEAFLQQGQKIAAIKYLCDTFKISLREAKLLVDTAEAEHNARQAAVQAYVSHGGLTAETRAQVVALLAARKKIEAVRLVKQSTNRGLKEALIAVEQVEKETNPNYRSFTVSKGCFGNIFKLIGAMFAFFGLIMALVAGFIYYLQSETIANSEKITGVVVELKRDSGGATAPVIAYQWNGERKWYHSTMWSTPPAYDLDEEVPIYVNRENPDEVVVDTFSDRWMLIAIFGGLGAFFVLFGGIFIFAGRKF